MAQEQWGRRMSQTADDSADKTASEQFDEIILSLGIWKDGKDLVVDLDESEFPLRCVKRNVPVQTLTPMRLQWTTASLIVTLLVGALFSEMFWGEVVDVNVGLSPELKRRQKVLTGLGWSLVFGGIIGMFLSVVAMVFQVINPLGPLKYLPVILPLFSVLGLPLLVIGTIPWLRVRKWGDDHVWISGVNPDYLKSLPDWIEEPEWIDDEADW